MKYRFLTILLAIAAMPLLTAARTAADLMVKAPRTVIPLIDQSTRLDMIDYFNSGMTTPSANIMEGEARITAMDDRSVCFDASSASSYQIALLDAGRDTIVAVVRTIHTPAPDSDISFYTTAWKPLQSPKYFTTPDLSSWLTREGARHSREVEAVVPFMLATYSYDPSQRTLSISHLMDRYLSDEDYDTVKEYLKPSLSYRWTGRKFVPAK